MFFSSPISYDVKNNKERKQRQGIGMQLLWTLTKKFNWTSLIYFTLVFHAVLISILISLEKEVKWLVGDPLQRYLEWCLLHFVCRKLLLQNQHVKQLTNKVFSVAIMFSIKYDCKSISWNLPCFFVSLRSEFLSALVLKVIHYNLK